MLVKELVNITMSSRREQCSELSVAGETVWYSTCDIIILETIFF